MNPQDQCDMTNQLTKMIQCAKGCTPPPDAGWIKGVTSALCYTVCLWRAVHVHQCIDAQLHASDPINLGIKVPVGDFDLWPNGGSQSSNCNQHNYFGDVVCSHVEAKSLFSANMRQNCHFARKCRNYQQYKSGKCRDGKISPIGWNLLVEESKQQFPNNYYMDTEFTSGDFCGITDVPSLTTGGPIETANSTTLGTINGGLEPAKGLRRDDNTSQKPKYSKWCLGMSWFGLCKSKTTSQSKVSINIQLGDLNAIETSTTSTLPSTTIGSTVGYDISISTDSITKTISNINTTMTPKAQGYRLKSKWCLGMSWFGLCVSKTASQPTSISTTTSSTTSMTRTTRTNAYSDVYYNY